MEYDVDHLTIAGDRRPFSTSDTSGYRAHRYDGRPDVTGPLGCQNVRSFTPDISPHCASSPRARWFHATGRGAAVIYGGVVDHQE